MAEVRRYSRSARVVTEVQPSYKPASEAAAQTFDTIRQGFDAGVKFMRPAVEREQTVRGEAEAMAAIDDNSFEMRGPFTIADAAFNKTGERVITNRSMIQLDEEITAALQKADGRISVLNQELDRIKGEVGGGLPPIEGLQTRWLESFDRAASTGRRQTTELAQRRAVAAQKQAAADAAARIENEVARLALTAGTPEDLAAALTDGTTNLAQYGPRGAFTLNGVEYPADPSRAGVYTPRQLSNLSTGLQQEAHELFLRADYERSDSPAQWASEFRESVLSGNSPLPPSQALTMLGQFESAARADEAARLREENAVAQAQADAAERLLNPFVTAIENGVYTAPQGPERQAILDAVAGNPNLTQQVETNLAAADAVVELQNVPFDQHAAYIERTFQEFAATDGISAQEAAVIEQLSPFLKAARQAITRETVGVSAAEQLLSSGGILSSEQIAEMRVAGAGNPEVMQSIAVLEEAQSFIVAGEAMTGAQREEWRNSLDSQLAELAVSGGNVGAGASLRLKGLELAQKHYETLAEAAQDDVAEFARLRGIEMPPLAEDENTSLAQVAGVIADRVALMRPETSQYGNTTPVPLSSSEIEMLSDMMRTTNNTQRVEFLQGIVGLPPAQSEAILGKLGVDNPPLLAAGRVVRSNPAASRAILAGMNMLTPVPNATKQGAELAISGVIMAGNFDGAELNRIRTTAEAYAKGVAARAGLSEVDQADLEKGYDIALGADENGVGGIETVKAGIFGTNYGTAVLPTGVSGELVARQIDSLTDANLAAFAGGTVLDGMGRAVQAGALRRSIQDFRTVAGPDGRTMLVPMTAEGDLFLVDGPDGVPGVFMFDPRGD